MRDRGAKARWIGDLRIAPWPVAGLLLAAALMFLANWEADRQQRLRLDSFRSRLVDLAQLSESIIARTLRKYDEALLVLRDAYVIDPGHIAEYIRLMRSGSLADREVLLVLVDRDGYLAYTDAPNVQARLALADRMYFRYFAEGGKDRLYIDEPVFGRVTRRYTLPLSRPIYAKDGTFLGVLAISVKQQSLVDFDSNLPLFSAADARITIVNQGGAIVSSTGDFAKVQGTKLARELLAPMVGGAEGLFESDGSPEGIKRVYSFRHITGPGNPLIVFVEASTGALSRDLRRQRLVLVLGAGFTAFIILVLVAVYLYGRKVTAQLIEALRRSKKQEYEILTETSLAGFLIADGSSRIVDVNRTLCGMLGYSKDELLGLSIADIDAIESPEMVASHLRSIRESGVERFQSSIRCKDGGTFAAEISVQHVDDSGGRFFAFVNGITDRLRAEEGLRRSLEEKEVLLREVHHRVKNNLNIISSLLNLQSIEIKEPEQAMAAFRNSRDRISTMALVHEELYKSQDFSHVDMGEFLGKLTDQLAEAYGPGEDIRFSTEAEGLMLSVNSSVPCGLILNELIANAIKHAFPKGGPGEIRIRFGTSGEEHYELSVSDDGTGMNDKPGDRNRETLGLTLVGLLVEQLAGTMDVSTEHGTAVRIVFPRTSDRDH
jgi:PAS domain S-box-containing protein